MTYNLHPIIVHFPMALLFVYSLIKIIPVAHWWPKISWAHIERALLLLGFLGALVSLSTGEAAEQLVRPDHQLVELHAFFAGATTWLYGALFLGEILLFITADLWTRMRMQFLVQPAAALQRILTNSIFAPLLAVLGFVSLMLTGMFGGVLVYGVTADPFARVVLNLFGINY